jgi:hypothetical protein
VHDPPAADGGSQGQGRGGDDDDPGRDVDGRDDARREQREGDDASIRPKATMNPMAGEVTIGIRTLFTMPSILSAPEPAAATVAPSKPPMRACELELGIPKYHVIRFQAIAPIRAAITTDCVVVVSSTRPAPIVLATAVPANAPMKLNAAAMRTATRGLRALVATEVAMALAVSWNPLM